jgi:hypothetical protein
MTNQLAGGDIPSAMGTDRSDPPESSNAIPVLVARLDHALDDPQRRYGLRLLTQSLGVPVVVYPSSRPDLYYGFDPLIGRSARVWIRPASESFSSRHPPRLTLINDVPVLHQGDAPLTVVDRNRIEFDMLQASAYWTTLASEQQATHRDSHRRVPANASLLGIHDLLHRPPIHGYCELLSRLLWPSGAPSVLLTHWPNGRKWAALITHDVDLPERTPIARSLLKELIRPRSMQRRDALYALRAEIMRHGLFECLFAGPTNRREWDFGRLCDKERRSGIRSAFYFATINRRTGHPNDVDYDIQLRRYQRLLGSLNDNGFEIGLHAAYSTAANLPDVADQLARLTSPRRLNVHGIRHHYLQLDPDDPMRTLRDHAAAGLSYDSSIGFNDAPGFRAGINLPFHPYHSDTANMIAFVELPMTLADMHLPTHDTAAAMDAVRSHLECVRSLGGLAVLNWHVGHSQTHPGWRAGYMEACDILRRDPNVWTPTPAELAHWWIHRTAELDRAATDFEETDVEEPELIWPRQVRSSAPPFAMALSAGRLPNACKYETVQDWLVESASLVSNSE